MSNLDNTPNHEAITRLLREAPGSDGASWQQMGADAVLAADTAAAAAIAALEHL